jgi:hypothetical protein
VARAKTVASLFSLLMLLGCGGTTEQGPGTGELGGSGAVGGTGGSGGNGAWSATGGSPAVGGGGGSGAIDCSMVGCALPPACEVGCSEVCGCCPCGEGQVQGDRVCRGGCWALGDPAGGCSFLGVYYPVGAQFAAGDGCNSCTCLAPGEQACTELACSCDPVLEEQQREYVGTSADECAVIDFACPQHTTYFGNACGCGCEQSPSCPEWFDCMPTPDAPPCDEAQIHTECPYSGIAY